MQRSQGGLPGRGHWRQRRLGGYKLRVFTRKHPQACCSAARKLSFAFDNPVPLGKVLLVLWNSHINHQITHFHAQRFGDPHQSMNADGLFSAFNLAEINRMQLGSFREFFLAHASFFAAPSNSVPNQLLMWQPFRHAYTQAGSRRRQHIV